MKEGDLVYVYYNALKHYTGPIVCVGIAHRNIKARKGLIVACYDHRGGPRYLAVHPKQCRKIKKHPKWVHIPRK